MVLTMLWLDLVQW